MNHEVAVETPDNQQPVAPARNGLGALPRAEDTLPDEPLFSITPSRGWVDLNLRELWAYRELLTPDLAGHQGPLQADRSRGGVGGPAAGCYDGDLTVFFGKLVASVEIAKTAFRLHYFGGSF